jgi:hypothetical protein
MRANTKITQNSSWESWGSIGVLVGFFLTLIGVLTQILEVPRIYSGATNFNAATNATNALYLIPSYYHHWWPWTYAACLFGLFTFAAGIVGILSGLRRTYTSIYGFFTMSSLSAFLAIYLIVYFSFIISFYRSLDKDKASNRLQVESVSYGLACTQLVVALLNLVLSIAAAVLSGRAVALCVPKGVSDEDMLPIAGSTPLPPRAYTTANSRL